MKVRAIRDGLYFGKRIHPGEVFEVEDKSFFSKKWMVEVEESAVDEPREYYEHIPQFERNDKKVPTFVEHYNANKQPKQPKNSSKKSASKKAELSDSEEV